MLVAPHDPRQRSAGDHDRYPELQARVIGRRRSRSRLAVSVGMLALGVPLLCGAAEIEKPAVLWDRALEGDVYGSALAGDTVVLLTLPPGAVEWRIEARHAESGAVAWQRAAPGTSLGPAIGSSIIVSGRDGI